MQFLITVRADARCACGIKQHKLEEQRRAIVGSLAEAAFSSVSFIETDLRGRP